MPPTDTLGFSARTTTDDTTTDDTTIDDTTIDDIAIDDITIDEQALDDDAMALDDAEMAELLDHSRDQVETGPTMVLSQRVMNPEGVDDPFPNGVPRPRPRAAGTLLSLGVGLAAGAALMARVSLKPDCTDPNDVVSCEIPNGADIGVRSGRLFAAVGFSVGGAAFGALGGRALGLVLQDGPVATRQRRRRIAIGLGATSLAVGLGGLVAGSTVFGLNARRAVDVGNTLDGTTTFGPNETATVEQALGHVDSARVGLMTLVAAPAFIGTGVALLIKRPRQPRVALHPQLSRTHMGMSMSVRF